MSNVDFQIFCADVEATGLLHQLVEQGDKAKLHNFCVMDVNDYNMRTYHTDTQEQRNELQELLSKPTILIMHNGICYDKNALKHFGYDLSNVQFVDTLALSWYLDLNRDKHGLEDYGVEFGVPKPEIVDWESLTQEDYDNRVQEDVKIQIRTYKKLKSMFEELYGEMTDYEFCTHTVVRYLNFKMEQLEEQQNTKFRVDIPHAEETIAKLEKEIDLKVNQLRSVMPKVPVYTKHTKPAKPFKKDGSLSATGEKWKLLCEEAGVDFDFDGEIKKVKCYNEPNPSSPNQVKDWLFSLGWKPETYKYVKSDSGERAIPQVYIQGSGGQVCQSIEKLAETHEEIQHLVGLGVLSHRKGCVKGFLDSLVFGEYVEAGAKGFTNTLRLKHRKPCVNLPSSRVIYGEKVRSCLVAREGMLLGGADLSSLENRIKFNLQMPYDREYVLSQMSEDFDPHLQIAQEGGLLGQHEVWFYKIAKEGFPRENYPKDAKLDEMLALPETLQKEHIKRISEIRGKGKGTNYSCLPMDTQVLTTNGLKYFDEISVGDKVLSYKDGNMVIDTVRHKHFYKDAEVVTLSDTKKSIRATLNHRWLVQKRVFDNVTRKNLKELSEVSFVNMEDFNTETKILTTAPYVGGISGVEPLEARLVGWILSDGSFNSSVTVAQSIEKYFVDVEETLNALHIKYSIVVSKRENGNHVKVYTLDKKQVRGLFEKCNLDLTKEQDFTDFLLGLSSESLNSFVESFYLGDGDSKNTKSYTISQNEGQLCDAVRLALFLQGDGRVKTEGSKKCKIVRKHKTRHISCNRKVWRGFTYEDVFCLTTDNGSFVIVQDGEMMLTGNCQYGAGAATVARTAGVPLNVGKALVQAYKKVNWSIEKIAESQVTKQVSHGTYQLNPYNGIWYHLKTDKDRFSTLVQGTGSYVLDLWLAYQFALRKTGKYGGSDTFGSLLATFHDEQVIEFKEDFKEDAERLIRDAIIKVNQRFNLEIPFDCDVQFGVCYADIH